MTSSNFKTILFLLLALIPVLSASGQEYKVKSFEILPKDLTARIEPRSDMNGRKCALVKVYVADKIAAVRGNVIGDVKATGMEKYVYLSHDSKNMQIVFENHLPITINFEDYLYPTVSGQMTYALYLIESNTTDTSTPPQANVNNVPQGNMSATVQTAPSYAGNNKINGHEYVDLGLPSGLKWATMNVGATSPSDYGSYFAWGETQPKEEYTGDNSRTWEQNYGDIGGNVNLDASRANWGGSWRLPTYAEYEELLNQCTWTYTTVGNHKGYKVIGPNGNYIFFPAAGCRNGSSLFCVGEEGFYWTSQPYIGFDRGDDRANVLYFYDTNFAHSDRFRYLGLSVRPVSN